MVMYTYTAMGEHVDMDVDMDKGMDVDRDMMDLRTCILIACFYVSCVSMSC